MNTVQTGNPQLIELIRSRIADDGPVSFAWFMEQALYHPQHGYYSSGRAKIGRSGDYFTNVSVGPVFGRLLAAQVAEIWQQLGEPREFTLVEQGAHHGTLARDILAALSKDSRNCLDAMRYWIVEPFDTLRQQQARTLAGFDKHVRWFDSLDALEPFVGLHLSNELLDAMPVHLVRRINTAKGWSEKHVTWINDQFAFMDQPVTDPRVQRFLREHPDYEAATEIEVNLGALDWLDTVSQKLRTGYVLTIDYGYVDDGTANKADAGTVQCRAGHQMIASPFSEIGNCDITAHVNWTMLARHAQRTHLQIVGFTDQHHFLTGIITHDPALVNAAAPAARRQLQTLLHPEMMGRSFQVLALGRGINRELNLSGFQFARPVHQQLGIAGVTTRS